MWLELVEGILEEGWVLRVSLGGILGAGGWRGFGVSISVGLGGFGSVSGIWGLGMVLMVVGLITWAVGDGIHALHWNMLSWFGWCTKFLRGFLLGWVVRAAVGGCML